jgi:hypothetical protein
MPLILLAGVVAGQPKVATFPAKGRPHAEVRLACEDGGSRTIFRVLGFDERMTELEVLQAGDGVAIQGMLQLEHEGGKIVSLFVVANMITPLRRRSPNLRFSI